jgi:heme-degrading monooxygenase HmoA
MNDTILDRRDAPGAAVEDGAASESGASDQGRVSATGRGGALHPVVLHCDLKVDPRQEQAMLAHFHDRFRPVAATFEGFIDLKMLKLRTVMQGPELAEHVGYRFQLTYESEELRQLWVASAAHAEAWPGIGDALIDTNFHVSLWDDV